MIIRWVKDLEDTAKARQRLQSYLDGQVMSDREAKSIELKIGQYNGEIETIAKRINSELQRAALKRVKVEYPRGLETIEDRALRDYMSSVQSTIGHLNKQIQRRDALEKKGRGREGANAVTCVGTLKWQEAEALVLEKRAKDVDKQLEKAEADLNDREKKVLKQIADREKEVRRIEKEIARASDEQRGLKLEYENVTKIYFEREREMRRLEQQRKDLDGMRNTLPAVEVATGAPAVGPRAVLTEKIAKVDATYANLKQFVEKHLRFQLQQFSAVDNQVRWEILRLQDAINQQNQNLKYLHEQLGQVKQGRASIAANRAAEAGRRKKVARTLGEIRSAQRQARALGVEESQTAGRAMASLRGT